MSSLRRLLRSVFPCVTSEGVHAVGSESPSKELFLLARGGEKRPDIRVVRRLVRCGANVTYQCLEEETSLPTLVLFAIYGLVDCFVACLETSQPVDFSMSFTHWTFYSRTDGRERNYFLSLLGSVCLGRTSEEVTIIVKAIVKRLSRHIAGDHIDWEDIFNSQEKPVSFLSYAAIHNMLHIVWPLLRDLEHYRKKEKPIPLQAAVCEADWARLTDNDRFFFSLLSGFADAETGKLRHLSLQSATDVAAVRRCVRSGGRVTYFRPVFFFYPIGMFILNNNVECLAACLETPHPIDFTMNEKGRNVFIEICLYSNNEKLATAMLKAVVKRIAEDRPGDKVDFEQRDWFGHDFFSYAAEYDLLHVAWEILKPLPFFQEKTHPIRINRLVSSEDWDQLSEEDLKYFVPEKGFVGTLFRSRRTRIFFSNGVPVIRFSERLRWTKLYELGRGGFGVVHLVKVNGWKRLAMKVPHWHLEQDNWTPKVLKKVLEQEIEIMKHLRHKNIVEFYGAKSVSSDNGEKRLHIFLEYCPGLEGCPGSLAELLRKKPEMFSIQVARRFAREILEGVAYLHKNNVAHRDLKPGNILLTSDGVIKITDFGCSCRVARTASPRSDQDEITVVGTPLFMPPEVLLQNHRRSFSRPLYPTEELSDRQGNHRVTPDEEASAFSNINAMMGDIWSFGCTVVTLLLRNPWGTVCGTKDSARIWKLISAGSLPSGIPDDCPPDLYNFFTKCFDCDPTKRWTAAQLLEHPWMTCADEELTPVPSVYPQVRHPPRIQAPKINSSDSVSSLCPDGHWWKNHGPIAGKIGTTSKKLEKSQEWFHSTLWCEVESVE